jgi:hypothetical protein
MSGECCKVKQSYNAYFLADLPGDSGEPTLSWCGHEMHWSEDVASFEKHLILEIIFIAGEDGI